MAPEHVANDGLNGLVKLSFVEDSFNAKPKSSAALDAAFSSRSKFIMVA
jgi:hypothetical protein